jgi:hypothetical protein
MTVFQGAVDATFAAFGIDAVYTPAGGGEPVSVRVIAKRPDTIVGFGDTRIHAETATFEVRASEVATRARTISSRWAARPSSSRASRSDAIRIGWCGPWTFDQPDVVRLEFGAVLCRLQGESSHVAKSLFACLGRHLFPCRSAPFGTDRLRLERGDWRLERTDVAELGRHHCGGCPGLLRVQPCPTVCTKSLFQLN